MKIAPGVFCASISFVDHPWEASLDAVINGAIEEFERSTGRKVIGVSYRPVFPECKAWSVFVDLEDNCPRPT